MTALHRSRSDHSIAFETLVKATDIGGLREITPNYPKTLEPLLIPGEAAAYLRLHSKTVIRKAREGQIPAIRIGKHWRFRASDLTAWAASQVPSRCQPAE